MGFWLTFCDKPIILLVLSLTEDLERVLSIPMGSTHLHSDYSTRQPGPTIVIISRQKSYDPHKNILININSKIIHIRVISFLLLYIIIIQTSENNSSRMSTSPEWNKSNDN